MASLLFLWRSKYYLHKIDAVRGVRLIVPHAFATITEARQFMSTWKHSYYVRKPEYVGFLIDRGSTLLDAAVPLPLEPYIVNSLAETPQI